jgi:hypothetical protein
MRQALDETMRVADRGMSEGGGRKKQKSGDDGQGNAHGLFSPWQTRAAGKLHISDTVGKCVVIAHHAVPGAVRIKYA